MIAAIFIIWAGITYMFAGGDEGKVETAKKRFWSGVIGALIVIGIGVVLATLTALVNQEAFFNSGFLIAVL